MSGREDERGGRSGSGADPDRVGRSGSITDGAARPEITAEAAGRESESDSESDERDERGSEDTEDTSVAPSHSLVPLTPLSLAV